MSMPNSGRPFIVSKDWKSSPLRPLTRSEKQKLTCLRMSLKSAENRGELLVGQNRDRPTKTGIAHNVTPLLRSTPYTLSVGNSDKQQGAQMSLPPIARDEEIRCVSPQRLVPASSASRVIPFPAPVSMSDADRLHALKDIDPHGHAMIVQTIAALYKLRASQRESRPNGTQG